MTTIRVILADDHALVRQGTRRILEEHDDLSVVGEAGNGEEALELIKSLHPDVAIIDIQMPKVNGMDVVRRANGIAPNTKLLVLSAHDNDEYIFALMEAGVSGYLLKTTQGNELVDAVRAVAQGKSVINPDIAMKVARLWARRNTMGGQGASSRLSPRETEVLQLAAKGLPAKDMAANLGISVRTVNGHMDSIFNKLGVSSRIQAILKGVSQHLITSKEDE